MHFFLPDWSDTVDPDYDFVNDGFSRASDQRYHRDVPAHELLGALPYDGLLVSITALHAMLRSRLPELEHRGIRDYLRLNGHPVATMGDCGAFSYVSEEFPPYSVDEVLSIYDSLRFDMGVAPDHLLVPTIRERVDINGTETEGGNIRRQLTQVELERRWHLTLSNAEEFYDLAKRRRSSIVPIGVAHGWDAASYATAAEALVGFGYKYIALGGLVWRKTEGILEIASSVTDVLRRKQRKGRPMTRLHAFGVARLDLLPGLIEMQVTSCDSGAVYRNAWTRARQNYLSRDGSWFTALRVRQCENPRNAISIEASGVSRSKVAKLERNALKALQALDRETASIPSVVDDVLSYEAIFSDEKSAEALRLPYTRTLETSPWRSCGCPICETIGLNVLVFRGGNRNRRRGFHNLVVFYSALQKMLHKMSH